MSNETIKCPKYGAEYNKTEKLSKKFMFPIIAELIAFLVFAIGLAIFFAIKLVENPLFNTSTGDNNTLQVIMRSQVEIQMQLSLFFAILLGLIFVFCIWGVFKFNRIEKRILEIQEKNNKE